MKESCYTLTSVAAREEKQCSAPHTRKKSGNYFSSPKRPKAFLGRACGSDHMVTFSQLGLQPSAWTIAVYLCSREASIIPCTASQLFTNHGIATCKTLFQSFSQRLSSHVNSTRGVQQEQEKIKLPRHIRFSLFFLGEEENHLPCELLLHAAVSLR